MDARINVIKKAFHRNVQAIVNVIVLRRRPERLLPFANLRLDCCD